MRVVITEEEVATIAFLLKHTALPSKEASQMVKRLVKAAKSTNLTEDYVTVAKKMHHNDGTLEIDEGAAVSMGNDPGAYVQAWVWVYLSDVNAYRRHRSKREKIVSSNNPPKT
jgi:hypothetical protein